MFNNFLPNSVATSKKRLIFANTYQTSFFNGKD